MTQLECTFAGQDANGVWVMFFSDGDGIEFSDEDAFNQYCNQDYIDVLATESLRRVTACRKVGNLPSSVTFDLNEPNGNLLKVN
jgi:hypothetical protein